MAQRQIIASLPTCQRCGAQPNRADARFCGQCSAALTPPANGVPSGQRLELTGFQHVVMNRQNLRCPSCNFPLLSQSVTACQHCRSQWVIVDRRGARGDLWVFARSRKTEAIIVAQGVSVLLLVAACVAVWYRACT